MNIHVEAEDSWTLYYNAVFGVFLNAHDTYQVTGHIGGYSLVGINICVTKAIVKL